MAKANNSVLRWNATDGIINYCNGSFSRKCHKAPDEIIGTHIQELSKIDGMQLQHLNELQLLPGEIQTDTLSWKSEDGCEHTELASVHAITQDGQTVSEIQIKGLESEEELLFRNAMDELLSIITDKDSEQHEKFNRMLMICLHYLRMQTGIVGSSMGDHLDLVCTVGKHADMLQQQNTVTLVGSLHHDILNTDDVIAVQNLATERQDITSIGAVPSVLSYIGAQVLSANGPFGTLSFFSTKPRRRTFTFHEKRLVSLIANWIGIIVGNEEQLEFLSHQNEYYQSLFRTVPAMMMLCNKDGLILSTSDLLSTKVGIDPLKIPGQNCQRLFIDENKQKLGNALLKGDVKHLPLSLRFENGDTLEVELNSSIKHIGSMQGVRMIVLADVSERNQAMKEVEEQNRHLALINQSLNQFAFMASHDLQEPLLKIQQFSSFLEEDLSEIISKDGEYHLSVIVNSAKRMSTLINDLLAFSSAAKGQLSMSEVDLESVLLDIRSELDIRISESNIKFIVSELPTVQGDLSLIRQLFSNLISNSIKYKDDKREPVVQVSAQQNDGNTTITIKDNGIGFDQKLASRAFEPFSRLHTSKQYKGNGIGLSICATVCEKHNWTLSVNSEPGIGSEFTVTINQQS